MQRRCHWATGLALILIATVGPAWAKSAPSVYTLTRQSSAYNNATYDWSEGTSHLGYTQDWLALSLARVHELVPPPSIPRANQVAPVSTCPNGRPLRRWYVDPNIRFKVL